MRAARDLMAPDGCAKSGLVGPAQAAGRARAPPAILKIRRCYVKETLAQSDRVALRKALRKSSSKLGSLKPLEAAPRRTSRRFNSS